MSKRSGPNKENYEETRRNFLDAALEEFCSYGYTDASTTRIVEQSGMARGSLYYHFGDKYGLFEAVYRAMLDRAMHALSRAMDIQENPWDALLKGCDVFMDLCMDDKFRKIVLVESQSAIDFKLRLSIIQETLMKKLGTILPELLQKGCFSGHNENTASIFIMGYLGEIGRSFDFGDDVKLARMAHGKAFHQTLSKLHGNAG